MIRIILAVAISFTLSAVLTRVLIALLTRSRIGQPIREDGPQGHMVKAGTPTMGGLAIVAGALGGYGISDIITDISPWFEATKTATGLLVMAVIGSAGMVGFLDDWIKVSRERNLGLNARLKTLGLLTVAVGFAVLMVNLATGVRTEISFTRADLPGWDFGTVGWIVWAVVIIYATSNAVNLTDGLDGLAAGSGIFSYAAYTVIAFWIFRQANDPVDIYDVPHALDLAVVASAMMAGCAGFLWFNSAPADIFMGDTGSLAIGTGLAALALATNTHLLLPIIGAIYVVEATSVMLQVGWFKATRGKRLFRMAPIHHHFELAGWAETKVIIRFWLVAGGLTLLGLGLFYADWVATTEVR
ncbi:MAG: phospho-N-acetylmuramoyl-pentapeptide-transferase [Actinomycetota bacterium]